VWLRAGASIAPRAGRYVEIDEADKRASRRAGSVRAPTPRTSSHLDPRRSALYRIGAGG
jgi:hypothetical protein